MAQCSPEKVDLWAANIIADKPFRLATTAMANKAARAIWAMLTKSEIDPATNIKGDDIGSK